MQATAEPITAAALQALLKERTLAGDWVLDPHRTSVRLKGTHLWGLGPVNGVFREVSGHGTVSPDGEVSGTVTVATASIDTKNTRRDTHLRSKGFLDSGTYPAITYTADDLWPSGEGVTLTGTVTVRDRTCPLSFDAMASVQGEGEIWLDAEIPINRADFGLTWNVLGIPSMTVILTIHAVFTRR